MEFWVVLGVGEWLGGVGGVGWWGLLCVCGVFGVWWGVWLWSVGGGGVWVGGCGWGGGLVGDLVFVVLRV